MPSWKLAATSRLSPSHHAVTRQTKTGFSQAGFSPGARADGRRFGQQAVTLFLWRQASELVVAFQFALAHGQLYAPRRSTTLDPRL
jgi:hypothetical protein